MVNEKVDGSCVKIFKILGSGEPKRFFVSGLHGEEYKVTDPLLKEFGEEVSGNIQSGCLILSSLGVEGDEYVSTLDEEYYETAYGKRLLSLLDEYQPSIYLELHSYSNYSSLTDQNRIEKEGVPPLVDLGSGILAGSVSPVLRTEFSRRDFCFLLDIPKNSIDKEKLFRIMEIIATGSSRDDIVAKMARKYQEQTEEMIENYLKFYRGEL